MRTSNRIVEPPTVSIVTVGSLWPGGFDAAVAMIAAEQARPARNIAYVGAEPHGIRAELDALEPPWSETARIMRRADESLAGAVVVELDAELLEFGIADRSCRRTSRPYARAW